MSAAPATPPARKEHLDGTAVALLVGCCVLWGLQQVLVKATLPEVPPVWQAALRFIGAALCLGLWCIARGEALWPQLPEPQAQAARAAGRLSVQTAAWLAGLCFAIEFAVLFIGLNYTSASRLTLFLYTSPFWVAALLPLWVKSERLRPLQWLGLVCAFVAVGAALWDGRRAPVGPLAMWGDLLGLLGGLLWGVTTLIIRATVLSQVAAKPLLFVQLAISALVLPGLSWALGETWSLHYSLFAWGSIIVQAVLGAFLSYLAWMWMLTRYPATRLSVFVFLTPVFAMAFSNLWLGEAITAPLIGAMALVALGIVLVNRR